MFYDNTVCPGKPLWCCFVNGRMVTYFFSQHILNKAKMYTQLLCCCLKYPLAIT